MKKIGQVVEKKNRGLVLQGKRTLQVVEEESKSQEEIQLHDSKNEGRNLDFVESSGTKKKRNKMVVCRLEMDMSRLEIDRNLPLCSKGSSKTLWALIHEQLLE